MDASSSTPITFKLPDFVAMSKLTASVKPDFKRAGADSLAWFDSFNVLSTRKLEIFIKSDADLLVAYTYPYAGDEEYRTCLDFISLLFALDEITDDQNADDARKTMISFLNTLDGQECDGSVISRMTASFRSRLLLKIGPRSMRRLVQACSSYIDAVCQEAALRERGEVLGLEEYRVLRRENIALRLCFSLFEYCFGFDLPDEVFEDPAFIRMFYNAVDMIALCNDLYSYNMEQAREGHSCSNIVTVIIKEKALSLQETVDFVRDEFESLLSEFSEDKQTLRPFSKETDEDVKQFISALETWIIGNICWSFATRRYFGREHEEIRKTLVVELADRIE
ncbi:terpenoid synthase [Fomitiporia mediterranea MF3/22]|uniref:terpenoid synthase n=1 Tax=Fomitiporia mediterranea (strain MF3/22) TaxID=694068 RepID=UPI0004408694|nr:terpenoid synthase [Fomitiporia mediterranea MF3/22]EJD06758.1 terpenoid synthase [Fomitiporia mediterranea MF3/22]